MSLCRKMLQSNSATCLKLRHHGNWKIVNCNKWGKMPKLKCAPLIDRSISSAICISHHLKGMTIILFSTFKTQYWKTDIFSNWFINRKLIIFLGILSSLIETFAFGSPFESSYVQWSFVNTITNRAIWNVLTHPN